MNNQNQVQSKNIFCLRADIWSLLIGWFQIVGSVLEIVLTVVAVSVLTLEREVHEGTDFVSSEDQESNDENIQLAVAFLIASFILAAFTLITQLAAGIILIQGVHQQSYKKLILWTAVQIFFLIFTVSGAVLSGLSNDGFGLGRGIVEIIVALLCLWVVDKHKQELKMNSIVSGAQKVKDCSQI